MRTTYRPLARAANARGHAARRSLAPGKNAHGAHGMRRVAALRGVLAGMLAAMVGGCAGSPSEAAAGNGTLVVGTWGAEGAGVIVSDSLVHVHIGCTKGDFRPPSVDETRSFNVAGEYILRAFPVVQGPPLPARFTGVINGNRLTLAVAIDDTVEKRLVALGPVTVTLGREPKLGPCPICAAGSVSH